MYRNVVYNGRDQSITLFGWNENGDRKKQRWTVEDAEFAVEETIKSAKFLVENRNNLKFRLDSSFTARCNKKPVNQTK